MVGGRAQVLRPCWPFPLLMGLQSLLTPTTHTPAGQGWRGLMRGPRSALVPGNGGMWTRAQQSEVSRLLLRPLQVTDVQLSNVFLSMKHAFSETTSYVFMLRGSH